MHNVVLEILLFLGVFGLFAYIYFFYSIFKRLLIIKKYLLGFFLISFLFLLQFDGSLVYSKLNLSVLVVALFFIYATNQENKKRGK